jgi:hypothetical protein
MSITFSNILFTSGDTIFEDTCYAHVSWDNETLNANVQFTSAGLDDISIGVAPEDYV